MLAVIPMNEIQAARLEFGRPLEPKLTHEQIIQRMVAEYAARRDELWDVPIDKARGYLLAMLPGATGNILRLRIVLDALRRLGFPDGHEEEIPYLDHPDAGVRMAAMHTLAQTGAVDQFRRIAAALRDPAPEVRRMAVLSLGKLGQMDAIPLLQQAASREPALATLAAEAERRIVAARGDEFPPVVDAVIETAEYEDLAFIMAFCWKYVAIIAGNKDATPEIRRRAVRLLHLRRVRKAGEVFKQILAEPGAGRELRIEAVHAVGRCVIRSAFEAVLALLDSPDAEMREAAVTALGNMQSARAIEPLVARWGDETRRPAIHLALARLASYSGEGLLTETLDQKGEGPTGAAVTIDDAGTLTRTLPVGWAAGQLTSDLDRARREAALLLAFYGTAAEVAALREAAEKAPPQSDWGILARRCLQKLESRVGTR